MATSECRDRDDPLAGPEPERTPAVGREQSHDSPPLTGVGREQLDHPLVVAPGLTGERPCDDVLEPEVADGDRIGVAEHGSENGSDRPDADAGEEAEAAASLDRVVAGVELVDRRGVAAERAQRVGTAALD